MRIILFTILFLVALFLLGNAFLSLISWKKSLPAALAWGFCALLCLCQLLEWPMCLANCSFRSFFLLFTAILTLLLFYSCVLFLRNDLKDYYEAGKAIACHLYQHPVLTIVLFLLFVFYLYEAFAYRYATSDDAFYMAHSMEIIAQNSLNISHTMVWTGLSDTALGEITDASSLEALRSYLSVLSGIHSTQLARTGLLFAVIVLHLCAVLTAFSSFDHEKKSNCYVGSLWFLIFYITFQLFYKHMNTPGRWMMLMWEGKPLLPAFVFPMLISASVTLCRNDETVVHGKEWLSAAVALTAGVAVSQVGVILAPICYFLQGMGLLVYKRFRQAGKTLLSAVVAALPVILIASVTYFHMASSNSFYLTEYEPLTFSRWIDKLLPAFDFFQLVLFGFSAIWMAVHIKKKELAMLFFPSLLLFLTFANPFLVTPVSAYLTTPLVYYRLFWLVPVYLAPACTASEILKWVSEKGRERYLAVTAASLLLIFAMNGRTYMYRSDLDHRENSYLLTSQSVNICEQILNDWEGECRPVLLAPEEIAFEIRQYTSEIALAGGVRYEQKEKWLAPAEGFDMSIGELFLGYETMAGSSDRDKLFHALSAADVDYCFLSDPMSENNYVLEKIPR